LIVSIHIPKTAGRSFGSRLSLAFASRALFDYGDVIGFDTPEAVAHCERRMAEMRARKDELLRDYTVIHGHFIADKYVALFPRTGFTAFFRDPYQQTVSHYQFFAHHPEIDHPAIRRFHEARMSLPEFCAVFPNIQSKFLGRIAVEDLAMVGLMEQYERSVALFEAVFGHHLSQERPRENVNPARHQGLYPIDPATRRAVDTHRAGDIELYRVACEEFARLSDKYGV
jgi:hypothetical protein